MDIIERGQCDDRQYDRKSRDDYCYSVNGRGDRRPNESNGDNGIAHSGFNGDNALQKRQQRYEVSLPWKENKMDLN